MSESGSFEKKMFILVDDRFQEEDGESRIRQPSEKLSEDISMAQVNYLQWVMILVVAPSRSPK